MATQSSAMVPSMEVRRIEFYPDPRRVSAVEIDFDVAVFVEKCLHSHLSQAVDRRNKTIDLRVGHSPMAGAHKEHDTLQHIDHIK